jgi:hypothetical protein
MLKNSIYVINASTVLKDEEVTAAMSSLQTQISRDFAPAWGIDAELSFAGHESAKPPDGTWWLAILDDADQASAYGYHDVTNDHLPLGKVFAATDIKNGKQWTVTASHELLEMIVDPEINLAVLEQGDPSTVGMLYAYEVCDPCESEAHGYQIDGVLVSDFVFPAWFQGSRARNSAQFDFCKHIHEPFELAAGGYIGTLQLANGCGWQIKKAPEAKGILQRGNVGTRRERRQTRRDLWQSSEARFASVPSNRMIHDLIEKSKGFVSSKTWSRPARSGVDKPDATQALVTSALTTFANAGQQPSGTM